MSSLRTPISISRSRADFAVGGVTSYFVLRLHERCCDDWPFQAILKDAHDGSGPPPFVDLATHLGYPVVEVIDRLTRDQGWLAEGPAEELNPRISVSCSTHLEEVMLVLVPALLKPRRDRKCGLGDDSRAHKLQERSSTDRFCRCRRQTGEAIRTGNAAMAGAGQPVRMGLASMMVRGWGVPGRVSSSGMSCQSVVVLMR